MDPAAALLDPGYESLIELATGLLPLSVKQSCRLLWVDPDRLRERLAEALMPAMEAAKAEIRRRQALYRRRARLWQNDQERLDGLRIDLEAMKVPRCHSYAPETLAKGLFERHRVDAFAPTLVSSSTEVRSQIGAKVQPSSLNEWIADLALSIEAQKSRPTV